MKKVNLNGCEVDFDTCAILMDDEIREELHMELAPCTEQEFLDAYAERHPLLLHTFVVDLICRFLFPSGRGSGHQIPYLHYVIEVPTVIIRLKTDAYAVVRRILAEYAHATVMPSVIIVFCADVFPIQKCTEYITNVQYLYY